MKKGRARLPAMSKLSLIHIYLFIYDSKLVDNERTVKLKGGKQTVRQAIYSIIGNDNLKLRSVDKHIIIYRPETALSISKEEGLCRDSTLSFTLEGTLIDPVSYTHLVHVEQHLECTSCHTRFFVRKVKYQRVRP